MRLGILSDTHNHLARTRSGVQTLLHAGAEAIVHCGDLATPEILAACAVRPLFFVFGNHDADSVPHLEEAARRHGATCLQWGGVFELAGRKVGVTHGHLTTDRRRVEALSPDYVLSGHSHAAFDVVEGGIRRINPGALYRSSSFSVAILDLASDELRFLPVPR